MRRGMIIFVVVNVILLGFVFHTILPLLALLFDDVSADAIRPYDIPAPNSDLIALRPQLIPKIIHQTWKNETIPSKWAEPQQSCIDLHPDYEYKLWTDEKSREFIATEYPWFLETFDGYPYPIMRADSIRYFALAHYGGVYIDLDDGCNRRLDPLLSYTAWVRKTTPTGISNDAMGSVPQHPFFRRAIENLQGYNRNWRVPYITVMYSTGPLFLSVIWKQYIRWGTPEAGRIRILMPDEYNTKPWSFFTYHTGSSWHEDDAKAIFWARQHWIFLTISVLTSVILIWVVWFTIARKSVNPLSWWINRNKGYVALNKRDDDGHGKCEV